MNIKQLYDRMLPAKKAAANLIFGAIDANDNRVDANTPMGNTTLGAVYNTMSKEEKALVSWIAADITPAARHADPVDEFLSHFGIKGMRWGVRNAPGTGGRKPRLSEKVSRSDIKGARARVRVGKATLGDAHVAALRTSGERVATAVMADKAFWKRAGIATAAAAAGLGVAMTAPALLPTSALVAIAGGTTLSAFGGTVAISTPGAAAAGAAMVGEAIATTSVFGAAGAVAGKAVSNVRRAVTGNRQIDKSYEALGSVAQTHYTRGDAKVAKLLKRNSGKQVDIKQDGMAAVEDVLQHFGVRGMKWGIRKPRGAPPGPASEVKITKAKPGQKIKATGGKGHPPSEAAIKAVMVKQKAKASGVQSLTNEEIREAMSRMNMELKFREATAKYNPNVIKRGQMFISTTLGVQQSMEEVNKMVKSDQGQWIAKELGIAAKKAKTP